MYSNSNFKHLIRDNDKCHRRDPAHVPSILLEAHVSIFTPLRPPAVPHNPILDSPCHAPSNDIDSVIDICRATCGFTVNSAAVELERFMLGIERTRNNTVVISFVHQVLLITHCNINVA